jgi:hypothetical protein
MVAIECNYFLILIRVGSLTNGWWDVGVCRSPKRGDDMLSGIMY